MRILDPVSDAKRRKQDLKFAHRVYMQGQKLWKAIQEEQPLQMVGTVNAYAAIMAKEVGFRALYLSGAGVANISYGLPDSGLTTPDNVLEDTRRITRAVDLPLLVDIDTGWGQMASHVIKELERAGAAGAQIEDQTAEKRCGHLAGKTVVSIQEMCDRIRACRTSSQFVIMARTDAFATEGLEKTVERLKAYQEAGADFLFPEALPSLEVYKKIKKELDAPILCNLTEFGKTPLFTLEELREAGVSIALYPLSASRAMQLAALKMYEEIRRAGTQKKLLEEMQTREELYHFLNYQP